MPRAVVGAKRWRASALLFSLASGLAAAQQLQPLDVSTEVPAHIAEVEADTLAGQDVSPPVAGEPDRVPGGVGLRGSAFEEPNADDLCARATASRADYIPIWRAEFLRRNEMTAAYFDEHVTVIDTNVVCWQTGASFHVRYRVSYEWTSAELTDGFLILLYEHEPGWHHRNVPRDTLFGAAEVSRAIDWSIGSPSIDSVAMLKGLRFSTREQAIAALSEPRTAQSERRGSNTSRDGRASTPTGYQPSRESLLSRFPRFGHRRGLVRGAVPDRRAMAGELVPAGSPCDSPGHCAASPSWPRDREWRCSRETIEDELRATDWKAVTRVEVIPRDVRAAFGAKFMANPGAPWRSGCVQDGRLPGTQLVFAAHTPRLWFLSALAGGFATTLNSSFFCRDYDGDWLFSAGASQVESLSDLRAVPEMSIGPGGALEIKVEAILSGLQWVLAPGQSGRGPDTDAAALRGIVVEGERFGGPKGTVVASIEVWLPDPVGGACRKHAGPTFP